MQRRLFIGLYVALTIVPLPVCAQGLGEFTGLHAGAAGMGAGLAASQHNGALVRNTYGAAVRVQQSIVTQNQAIEQYLALGIAYEAKKQWVNAEDAFTNALKWICNRDGPGSPHSVPALQHLAKVSKNQNKLDQAIGYQKTVVAFAQRARIPDTKALLGADRFLSDMYVQKGDYADAEPVLKEAVALLDKTPHVSPEEHIATLKVYGRVLRELNKTSEADAIDASLAANVKPVGDTAAVSAVGTAPIGATRTTTITGTAPFVFPAAAPAAVSAPSQAVAPAVSTVAPVATQAVAPAVSTVAPVATQAVAPAVSTVAPVATQASAPAASLVASPAATHASAPPVPVAVTEATQASTPAGAPSAPLVSPALPPQASSNASPADQVPVPATAVTNTTTSVSEPAVKANQTAASVGDRPEDRAAPTLTPSATTNEKPGDKTTSSDVEKKAAATIEEKPAQPPSEQPANSESKVQSQSSDQPTKQAEKAN